METQMTRRDAICKSTLAILAGAALFMPSKSLAGAATNTAKVPVTLKILSDAEFMQKKEAAFYNPEEADIAKLKVKNIRAACTVTEIYIFGVSTLGKQPQMAVDLARKVYDLHDPKQHGIACYKLAQVYMYKLATPRSGESVKQLLSESGITVAKK